LFNCARERIDVTKKSLEKTKKINTIPVFFGSFFYSPIACIRSRFFIANT